MFSTQYSAGIRVGTAVGLFVQKEGCGVRAGPATVRYRDFWGAKKCDELLSSVKVTAFDEQYEVAHPQAWNKFSFHPSEENREYLAWPRVADLAAKIFNGPIERRGMALISIEKSPLEKRIKAYFDPEKSNEEIASIYSSLMMTGNRIVGKDARIKILKQTKFDSDKIVKYPFKPLDIRYCYLDNIRPLFSEASPELLSYRMKKNWFFISRDSADKTPEGVP